jgi:PAS domain S-box-containing protein
MPNPQLNACNSMKIVTKLFAHTPLQVILVVPFVLQIVGTVGIVGYLSFKNGQQTVSHLADRLMEEIGDRTVYEIQDFLDRPYLVHQTIVSAIHSGNLNPNNLQQLKCYFLQLALQPDLSKYIAFANPKGEFVNIDAINGRDKIWFKIKDSSTGSNRNTYRIERQCQQQELISSKPYDPTTRPWYQAAVTAKKPTWSPIYLAPTGKQLGFSAATPVYSKDSKLLGVLSTELNLKHVEKLLQDLERKNGIQAFAIDRDGKIIASNFGEYSLQTEGQLRQILATESNETLIRTTAVNLLKHFGSFAQIKPEELITFELKGKRIFARIASLKDEKGLDWSIVITVPEAAFMEEIERNTQLTMALCFAAFGVSVLIGISISRWITKPIADLNEAAKKITTGDLVQIEHSDHSDELGQLTESFNLMIAYLQASFDGLNAFNETLTDKEKQLAIQNQTLEIQVQERTKELRQTLEQLQATQRFIDRVLDTISDPIFVKDEQHRWIVLNRAACQFIGRKRENLIGKTDHDFFSRQDADRFREKDNLVFTTGVEQEQEQSFTDGSGVLRTVLTKKALLADRSGNKVLIATMRDITHRKATEEALQESEKRLQTFFNNAPAIVYIKNLAGKYLLINRKFETVINISRVDVLGKTDYDLFPEDIAEAFRDNDRQALESELPLYREEVLTLEDGVHTYFSAKFPLIDSNGIAYATCGIATDISDRKLAEAALRDSEERFRTAFEQAAVGIVQTDLKGQFRQINQKFCEIVGYSDTELFNQTLVDITYPDDLSLDRHEIERLLTGEIKSFSREKRYVRQDSSLVWLNISISLVRNALGKPDYLMAIVQDISERKQAQEALQTQSLQFQAMLNNIPHFAWLKDLEGRFIAVNEPFASACYLKPEELIGLKDFDIWEPHLAQLYYDDDREVITTRQRKQVEEPLIDDLDELRWMETIKTPIFNERDEVIGTTGITIDITDRKLAADAIRQKNQELTTALEQLQLAQNELVQSEKMAALGQLVAGIAHEINTPLGAIQASIGNIVSALERSIQDLPPLFQKLSSECLREFLNLLEIAQQPKQSLSFREERQLKRFLKQTLEEKQIANSDILADSLSKMGIALEALDCIESLLQSRDNSSILETAYQLSAIQNNSQNIKLAVERASKIVFALKNYARQDNSATMVKTSITDSIDTVLTIYHNQLKQGIEVTKNYGEAPPILCYPEELTQVWTNLIHNAIQAMNYNGQLAIAVSQKDTNVVVEITDSGAGIPVEIQEKIFQPFFTTKPAGEGSGLGLDIVRKIVEKHQGKIILESQLGQTKFSVWLPIN